jgi:hypothetical protein
MNTNNKNNSSSQTKKIHNPKANLPAVYIPCWLIQVPVKQLSHAAKIVYGRLTQWCDESGTCFRSTPQLAEELGMCETSVKNVLRELREIDLIGTFHPQAGGVNHFEFYDHPLMHEPINKNLVYKNESNDPPEDPRHDHARPPARSCPTPRHDHARINKKEIKRNINNISTNDSEVQDEEKNKTEVFGIQALIRDNPHEIPKQLLKDWVHVRKIKRAAITNTAWQQLNKKLQIIQETKGVSPLDAFTRMVTSAWLSIDPDWFGKNKINNDDTSWGKDFYVTNELGI